MHLIRRRISARSQPQEWLGNIPNRSRLAFLWKGSDYNHAAVPPRRQSTTNGTAASTIHASVTQISAGPSGISPAFQGTQGFTWGSSALADAVEEATLFALIRISNLSNEVSILGCCDAASVNTLFRLQYRVDGDRFTFQMRNSNNDFLNLGSPTWSTTNGTIKTIPVIGVYRTGTGQKEIWVEGQRYNTSTTNVVASAGFTFNRTDVGILSRNGAIQGFAGEIFTAGIYDYALSEGEIVSLSENMYRPFYTKRKTYFFPTAVSAATTDLSANGAATAIGAGAALLSSSISAGGASTAVGVGAAILSSDLNANGSATGILTAVAIGVSAGDLTADGSATATGVGAALLSSDLSAAGASTAIAAAAADIVTVLSTDLSAAGASTAIAAADAILSSDLSAAGASTAIAAADAILSSDLSAAGASTATLVGEDAGSFTSTALGADGASIGTLTFAALLDAAISADGAGTATGAAAATLSAALSADGAATGTLEGLAISGYVTADLSAAGAAEATAATATIVESALSASGRATAIADTGQEAANAYLTWGSQARRVREMLDTDDEELVLTLAQVLPAITRGRQRWQAQRRTGATASSAVLH